MEVVCLILGRMLTSQPCFDIPTSSFIFIENVFYYSLLPEISAHHLQLKCMGGHFFPVPSLHREYYHTL